MMFGRNLACSFIVLPAVLFFYGLNISFAEDTAQPPAKVETPSAAPAPQKPEVKPTEPKVEAKARVVPSGCSCEEEITKILDKSYTSLEEDDWPDAIKVCTDTLSKIKELENTCKCEVLAVYKDVAQGYLNYGKGGEKLESDVDLQGKECDDATKLYADAIALFEKSIPKITNEKIKKQVETIKQFSTEENEFVKEECL